MLDQSQINKKSDSNYNEPFLRNLEFTGNF